MFHTTDQQHTVTGVIDPFLRVQQTPIEQGYNTSGSPLPFDDKAGAWTHDLRVSDVRGVEIGGTFYAAFLLDINESNAGASSLLTLDAVRIYTSPVASQTTTDVSSLGTLRYDLGNNTVELDAALNHGSGSGDLLMYIPAAALAGAGSGDYLYLYCAFGVPHGSDAGFEEWANFGNVPAVPAPGALVLAGIGGILVLRRKR